MYTYVSKVLYTTVCVCVCVYSSCNCSTVAMRRNHVLLDFDLWIKVALFKLWLLVLLAVKAVAVSSELFLVLAHSFYSSYELEL